MTELVSVIMPVYNLEKYVEEAIQSVFNQTYTNWELLIVDDGSTDRSLEIIRSFSDSRIRVYTQPNQGVSAARNRALKEMKGDFFCFLDGDDRLTQNSLQSRLLLFQDHEAITFVDGTVVKYSVDFSVRKSVWTPLFSGNPLSELVSLSGSCFFGPTWMIRRETLKIYEFNEQIKHGEDLLFYVSIAYSGEYHAVSDEIYEYRTGNQSAMSNIRGLGKGYNQLYHAISKFPFVDSVMLKQFRKKSGNIMFKTYLRRGYLLDAMKLTFKAWKHD